MLADDASILAQIKSNLDAANPPVSQILGALVPLIGTGYAEGGRARAVYVGAILPNDNPAQALQIAAGMSSCGLVTEAGWRAAGVDDDRILVQPYAQRVARGGVAFAVAAERDIARAMGAWVDTARWDGSQDFPTIGDALIIGNGSDPANWSRGGGFPGEHELTVCATEDAPGGAIYVHSIDGGQPGVRLRSRVLVPCAGELWCAQLDRASGRWSMSTDGRPSIGRRVIGFARVRALRFRSGAARGNDGSNGASGDGVGLGAALGVGVLVAGLLAFAATR